jgi:peptidoglycan/xylan/chitin deacetylase (PgdA/CDA1 family)
MMWMRDFVGYGPAKPKRLWPDRARIAVSFVLNYEEGSEQSVLDGDARGESLGEVARTPAPGERDLIMESTYEYGSRAGAWRLLDIFDRHRVPISVYACAQAVERNPEIAAYLRRCDHEIVSHGYRWEDVTALGIERERENIRRAVEILTRTTGRRPLGWYCRYSPSLHTRRLLVEEGGFVYDCDALNDDLPYLVQVGEAPWCVVPHAFDTNDLKFWRSGMETAGSFFEYLKDTFDCLYREGESAPKMMTVSLHARVAGRPGRAPAIERFVEYAARHDGNWFARRIEIARAAISAFTGSTAERAAV